MTRLTLGLLKLIVKGVAKGSWAIVKIVFLERIWDDAFPERSKRYSNHFKHHKCIDSRY
jgi:hypothetical protein